MNQMSKDELYEKLRDDEEQRWPYRFYRNFFLSARILTHPDNTFDCNNDEADYHLVRCVGLIVDLINENKEYRESVEGKIEYEYSDDYKEAALYWFCKHEILSFFPDISQESISEWNNELASTFNDIIIQYPLNLFETVLELIDHVNIWVDTKLAETLFESYMKNCCLRYSRDENHFRSMCYLGLTQYAIKLSPAFFIKVYETYIKYIQNENSPIEYSDVLSLTAPVIMNSKPDEALDMLNESLRIRLLEFGNNHMIVGTTYCQLSFVYQLKNERKSAIATAIHAYESFPVDEQTIQLGHCLAYLVHSYCDARRYEEIPKWLEVVDNICRKNQGDINIVDLSLELSLAYGNYHMAIGDIAIAEKYFRSGIDIAEKNDPNNNTLERLRNNLSVLLGLCIGDMRSATDILSEYISDSSFKPTGNKVLSLMFKNAIHYAAETSEKAEAYARRALDEILAIPNEPAHMQKLMYARILLLNQKLNSHHELIAQLINDSEVEIIKLNSRTHGRAIEEMYELFTCKMTYAFMLKDYTKVEQLAKEITIMPIGSGLRHNVYSFCGIIFRAVGRHEEALSYFNDALETALARLNTAKKYLNESRVRDYLSVIRDVTNFYFSLTTESDVSASYEEQYNVILKTKALPSLIEQVKKDMSIVNPKQRQILEKIKKLRLELNSETHIAELELEYAAVDTTVLSFPVVSCNDIFDKMPPGSALIEFFEYGEFSANMLNENREDGLKYIWYAVFIAIKETDGSIEHGRVRDICSASIEEAARELRQAIEKNDCAEIAELRKDLYELILEENYEFFEGLERLYIAPDSDLATIPFELLGHEKYLMDEFEIIYLETGRDVNSNSGFVDKGGISVVIGNPQFRIEHIEPVRKLNRRTLFRGDELAELPMSNLEAQAVAKRLGTLPLLGAQATKYAVLECENPKILHIATHGHVNDLDIENERILTNPMLHSCLMMAGAVSESGEENRTPPFGNGILTATEIAQKELSSTDLVVLSACVTGLGKKVYSEIVGLKVAFKIAGAKNIIVSLWRVDDFATAVFMNILYFNLDKLNIYSALRQTKKTMRALTVQMLKESGFFAAETLSRMGTSAVIAKNLLEMSDDHMPFVAEKNWAGFICQQN